jgi:hypothetical protein
MKISLSAVNYFQLAAEHQGATVIPVQGMTEAYLRELRSDAAKQEYHGAMTNTPTGVTQNFVSCSEFEDGSLWKELGFEISKQLGREYENSGQSQMFSERPLLFSDLALQKYVPSSEGSKYGISPHRDQSGFVNLVAVLLISGPSAFFICRDKGGGGAADVVARPGDLILMRGGGYGRDLPRPFHFVGKIDDPYGRLSFGMRQVTSNGEIAAKIRNVFDPGKAAMQA